MPSGQARPGSPPPDPRLGQVLQDRYRVVELIAHGGMGAVYRGERLGLGRQVAVKFLRTTFARDPNVRRRFELEAEAMSRLSHPNCIGVLDFGVDGLPYLVMDLVLGEELRDIIDRGPLPIVRALRIARQVLAALAHAHERGIVHRDIKPENIVLEQGSGLEDHVRILDFGLAKLLGSDFGLTVGIAVGTPNYMAPEQAGEGGVDGRTDLYAAGIVLVEMLTGKKPFDAPEVGEVLMRQVSMPAPRLRKLLPDRIFSAELEGLVARALCKDPADRFESAAEMMAALDALPEMGGAGLPAAGHAVPPGPARADEPTLLDSSPAGRVVSSAPVRPAESAFEVSAVAGGARDASVTAVRRWRFPPRPAGLAAGLGAAALLIGLAALLLRPGQPGSDEPNLEPHPAGVETAEEQAPHPRRDELADERTADPAHPMPAKPETAAVSKALATSAPSAGTAPPRSEGAAKISGVRSRRARAARSGREAAGELAARAGRRFRRGRYTEGIDLYRQAIRLDPERASDRRLLDPLIASLPSDKKGERAGFLRELGPSARPALQAAATGHPNRMVRARAAELLRTKGARRPANAKRPFLKWL